MIESVPPIVKVLAAAVAFSALLATVVGRRGGKYRGLPGWGGFWVLFAPLLVTLSRGDRRLAFALLAAVMFGALRAYFSIAPVRNRDRWAILAAYLSIPFTLWPAYTGAIDAFLATVPVSLFLIVPVFLAIGPSQQQKGLLDAMGRTLLGVLFFVYCIAHLGLLVNEPQRGLLELFGLLALSAELPQRLAGRLSRGPGWWRPALGVTVSVVLAVGAGWWFGPWCGLIEEDGARAGFLVAAAVTMGGLVSNAVAQDLELSSSSSLFGRGVFLNRTVPTVYAVPVFFHYLNHFV